MARKEEVTRVIDGDTFETASRKNPVRLANVDTPGKGQAGAAKATTALRDLIQGKEVVIDTVAREKYDRSVADDKAYCKSVNRTMKKKLNK